MSTENGKNPAHPSSVSGTTDGGIFTSHDFEGEEGLSKREHFAGLAMQGFAADPDIGDDASVIAKSASQSSLSNMDL